jgi:CheY-like chemotaxis protein/HPt (histidine-containing phosphotransfer) domain-containing protein
MNPTWHVLIVEDDHPMRKLLSRQLARLGFQVDLACDGNEGLSLWQREDYDLVLTDFSMPGMDGFEFASKIRTSGRRTARSVPIIAITGYTEDVGSRCSAAGITDCIKKPFSAVDLRRLLDRWLPDSKGHRRDCAEALPGPTSSGFDDAPGAAPGLAEHSAIMRSVTKTFIETIPEYLQALHRASVAGSRPEIVAAAHKLKSAARLVGGDEVAELCEAVEGAGPDMEIAEILRLAEPIPDALRALEHSLSRSFPPRK